VRNRLALEKYLDWPILLPTVILTTIGLFVLNSIAPHLFPAYYYYVFIGLGLYLIISKIDFDLWGLFANHFYFIGLVSFIFPLVFGQITHGAIRWIQIGTTMSIQPSELVRPFLYLFVAFWLGRDCSVKRVFYIFVLVSIYVLLILVQPSLTVSFLTMVGFLGGLLAVKLGTKFWLSVLLVLTLLTGGLFSLAKPYQRERLSAFLNWEKDPLGTGYNSIQAVISVGSGGLWGKGFGKGTQTQLAFLPEKHNDFIMASIGEEFGILGILTVLVLATTLLFVILRSATSDDLSFASYSLAVFTVMVAQITINTLMNLGLFPVAGVNFPLVSYGGSSYIATLMMLGLVSSGRRRRL